MVDDEFLTEMEYETEQQMMLLFSDLEEKKSQPVSFVAEASKVLIAAIIAAYLIGKGKDESEKLEEAEEARIKKYIAEQTTYLKGFGKAMETEEWSNRWRSRAAMYAASLTTPFWWGKTYGLVLPAYPGDGSSSCLTFCKCAWRIVPLGDDNYDAYWELGKAEHCPTCAKRALLWSPLQIRAGVYKELAHDVSIARRFKHLQGKHDQGLHGNRGQSETDEVAPQARNLFTRAQQAKRQEGRYFYNAEEAQRELDRYPAKAKAMLRDTEIIIASDEFLPQVAAGAGGQYQTGKIWISNSFSSEMGRSTLNHEAGHALIDRAGPKFAEIWHNAHGKYLGSVDVEEMAADEFDDFMNEKPAPAWEVYFGKTKHYQGRHDQKRHGWRYGIGKYERRPLYSDAAETAEFDKRAETRVSKVSEQDVIAAKKRIRDAQARYARDTEQYSQFQWGLTDATKTYEIMRQESDRLHEFISNATEKLKKKSEALSDKIDELEKANLIKPSARRSAQIDKIRSQWWAVQQKIRHTAGVPEAETRIDELKRLMEKSLIDAHDRAYETHSRYGASNEIQKYLSETEDDRRLVLRYEMGRGEAVRRAAVAQANRYEGYAKRNDKVAREASDEQMEFLRSQEWSNNAHESETNKALTDKVQKNWEKAREWRAKANAVFGDSLFQETEGQLRVSVAGFEGEGQREFVTESMTIFNKLAGENPFMARWNLAVVEMGQSSGRGGYGEGVIVTPSAKEWKYGTLEESQTAARNTTIHELGHALESADPGIRIAAKSFLSRRAGSEQPSGVYGDFKIGNYDFTEYAYKDNFVDKYIGKFYKHIYGDERGVNDSFGEIVSMGVEYFHADPLKIARGDPGYFNFIFAMLRL